MPESRRRRRSLTFGLALLVGLGLTGAAVAKDIAVGREDDALAPIGSLVADEDLDPRILGLRLEGRDWQRAVVALDAALFDRADAQRRATRAASEIVAIRVERADLEDTLDQRRGEAAGLDDRIAQHEAALRERALELYVSFGDSTDLDSLGSPTDAVSGARVKQIAEEVDEAQLDARRGLLVRRTTVGEEIAALAGRIGTLMFRESRELDALAEAIEARDLAGLAVEGATAQVREARRHADVAGLPMSVVALDAYLRAETLLAAELPACGLEWWVVAGVGRVESHHGELGGRTIEPDGTVSTPIIGVALNGASGVRAVIDTDGGELDDDPVWDRAVGPMQFIPETWRIRGADADEDGRRDPQNIYDAAYASGRYLCRLGGDLTTSEGLDAAYFGYNTSDEYVADVRTYAEHYRGFALLPNPAPTPEIDDPTG